LEGRKVLLPRAADARPILPEALEKMGADVNEIPVYRTRAVEDDTGLLMERLETKTIDMITLTSSSTARNFKALIPPDRFRTLMEGITIAAIGPITADTAEKLGFEVHIVPETSTIPGLCEAIVRYFQSK
jgi:uroporphyrinogen III methyltransferase/synthase